MGLDIRIEQRRKQMCPKCGETIGLIIEGVAFSGGRVWCPILKQIGYYVPREKRTEENHWHGKDMILTTDQATKLFLFVLKHEISYGETVKSLIAQTLRNDNMVLVINADW